MKRIIVPAGFRPAVWPLVLRGLRPVAALNIAQLFVFVFVAVAAALVGILNGQPEIGVLLGVGALVVMAARG